MLPTTTKAEVRHCFCFSLTSAFVVVGRFAPDEERFVLLKPVVQFYFTCGVSRGFLCIYLNYSGISIRLLYEPTVRCNIYELLIKYAFIYATYLNKNIRVCLRAYFQLVFLNCVCLYYSLLFYWKYFF